MADDIVVIEFGHNDGGGATVSTGDCVGADTETTCDVCVLTSLSPFIPTYVGTDLYRNGTTVYTFNYYIENAVNSLMAKNANVIVSSQTPDNPYNTSFSPSRFVGYAETAASVSHLSFSFPIPPPPSFFKKVDVHAFQDTGAWYVDHFDLVNDEYEALGEDAVNALYPIDHTHTSPTGADYVAQAFIRGVLCDSTNPLYEFVTNSSVVPCELSPLFPFAFR